VRPQGGELTVATILVVDDRAINREFLIALLGHAGHEVHEARDGREALEVARDTEPDLVITDVLMPTMDGLEFTRRLAKDPTLAGTPVIFYTATYRLHEAQALAASCGVATIIAKPAEPQRLLDAVHGELGLATEVVAPEYITSLTGRHGVLAVDRLCSTSLEELTGLQEQVRTAIELDETPSAKARQLRAISFEIDRTLTNAQALSMRLAALVELGFDLAALDDPKRMLEMFCHAARDIMNARLAAVCVLNEQGGILEHAVWGMPVEVASEVRRELVPTDGLLGESMRDGRARRRSGLKGDCTAIGLPRCHPAIEEILVVPIKSASRTSGWFYVADCLGGKLSEHDEQFAEVLVAQLAREYENLVLYDRAKRQADVLEVEVEDRKEALAQLRDSEERFRQLAENIREVFFLIDAATGTMLYVSPAYEHVWRRGRGSLYHDARSWFEAVHPEDRAAVRRRLAAARRADAAEVTLNFRIRCGEETRWIRIRSFPIRGPSGSLDRVAGIAEDITEAELQERKIRRLSRIQSVLSGINSAIVRIHERGALLDEACRIAVDHGGFPLAWVGLVHPETGHTEFVAYSGSDPGVADRISSALVDDAITRAGPAPAALRARAHTVFHSTADAAASSRAFAIALENSYRSAIALPLMPDSKPAGCIVLFAKDSNYFDAEEVRLLDELASDVSFALEYIAREERLRHLAYYDALTDLPNMTLFQELLAQTIAYAPERKTALFLIDLDRFTHLNDTLGRHIGDQLLTAVARRLRSLLVIHAQLARVGSDTFAVAIPHLRDETEAGEILHERIFAALGKPFEIGTAELRVSARAGVAICPNDGKDADTLFKNAEAALKQAKTSAARFLFYSSELNERVAEDLALEQQLLLAVQRQEFVLHYQPKIEVKTGNVAGLEALIRWNSPDRGLVPPAHFIPMLETSELILDVGRWAVDKALADYAAWRAKGLKPPRVAVNVSSLQLRYPDFADMVVASLERHGVGGEALELEITESVIMADIESSIALLAQISRHGVTIAVDDFGTGYSSLRYLAKLPVHALKVDRSFIVVMTTDADSMTLVSTIIGLAHAFGLLVVAEGVESDEQAKFLTLMKCDVMQGYLYGEPRPAAETEEVLAARRESTGRRGEP